MTDEGADRLPCVVVAHDRYRQPGGEDAVVNAEVALLKRKGHRVVVYERHNDDIVGMNAGSVAVQTLWSRRTVRDITRVLAESGADLLHVHNMFPLVSPSIYWGADRVGVPVVQTLHNFRLLCPQAMLLRDGKVCEECVGRLPWRGAVRGCYDGSWPKSTVLAGMLALHRGIGTWRSKVTRYIALNDFCRNKLIAGGLPAERIAVKPNFVDIDAPQGGGREGFLFVGRLSPEKGVATLIEASSRLPEARVRIAGSGPELGRVQQHASPSLQVLGPLASQAVQDEMSRAIALVTPSICYDAFPITLLEAFACGLPVIASRLGALPALIQDGVSGLLFEPGNAADLERKMRWALTHRDEMAAMGRNARARYELNYTPERNYAQLMAIYHEALRADGRAQPAGITHGGAI